MTTVDAPQYVTVGELARELGVANHTVRRALLRGDIPHIRLGGPERTVRRILAEDARRYVESIRETGAARS